MQCAPGEAKGAPDHPHRGFETVTYMLSGRFEHKDSQGHSGKIEPGDVQWMTAGGGVIHSEMPEREFTRTGGLLHGLQLWVNLPKRDKMTPPQYQELKAAVIPHAETANGNVQVKVIAGESLGTRGAIQTRTPIVYLHLTLAPGATHVQEVAEKFNALAYIVRGKAQFDGTPERQGEGRLVLFAHDGGAIAISNPSSQPVDLLLLAGEPIGEPIARYGPFVMNTREEIYQAFADFRSGKLGEIAEG
jgi:redox-sensitive bicupin YhaK (pirin superfamily)